MRNIARATAIVVIILTTAVGLIAAWFRGSTILTTSSPSLTYTVTVAGRKDRPFLPIDHSVWMSVSKAGKPILSDQKVHSGDWLDPSYAMSYPNHSWESDNVLHLYRAESFLNYRAQDSGGTTPSKVLVRNNSHELVKFLRVDSGSMYLLFDLKPGSKNELLIPPSRGDFTGIWVEGVFHDDRKLRGVGETFKTNRPSTYYVEITGSGLLIENPDVEKYRLP